MKTNYLENALLAHELGHELFTRPTHHNIALFTSAPNDAGGGTEVSGNGYARKRLPNDGTLWTEPSDGSSSNAVAVEFTEPTGGWGTITHFGILDDSNNLLRYGALNTPRTIQAGFIPVFQVGALVISED